jgi:signal transduction histidine kinase
LNIEPVNLNTLVEQVSSEFALIAEEAKVQIIRNYDENLPDVPLDAVLMRQTLFNFVQNSIQAMPKGGSIYITTFVEQIDPHMRDTVIEIRDTGIGIPEEIQEQIYDAYFTTKDATGGIGLGLAVSHQIITAHKGKIEVRSKMGMGTAFKIRFPLNEDKLP